MIKIDFSFESEYGKFSDAIILPDDHSYTEAQIETMKQSRFDNWIAFIESPATEAPVIKPEN